MGAVVEFKNVTYTYQLAEKPAIKNVSFSLEAGKLYGVVGQNGSGKTTLCALIRGFAPSFYKGDLQGEVLIDGRSTQDFGQGELSLRIGYVFQNPFNQISGVKDTVFEEIAFGLENFGVPVEEIEQRVVDVMKLTNVYHLAEKNPFELSGGQQQRVALAAIIVLRPDILVIDEPTSQLDPEGTESVFKIIDQMKKDKKTVILVEHKVDLIAEFADYVMVFNDSQLIRFGETSKVLSDISLIEQGVALPRITVLCHALKEKGLPIKEIPITEKAAAIVLREILQGRS